MNLYIFISLLAIFLATSLTALFLLNQGTTRVRQWARHERETPLLHGRVHSVFQRLFQGLSLAGQWLMDRLDDLTGDGIRMRRHAMVVALTALCKRGGFQSGAALRILVSLQAAGFLLLPILGTTLLFVLGQQFNGWGWGLLVVAFAGAGAYLPVVFLRAAAYRRRQQILRSFPEALDLIMICVEAGLGLDAAIQRVGEEFKISCPPLYQEFRTLSLELRAGVPRSAAFANLADRIDAHDVRMVVATLTQADRLGTSLLDAVRVQSDQLRLNRRLKAEERAAQIGTKLLFPLIFFLFPALFLVLVGPAVLSVLDHFPRVVSP